MLLPIEKHLKENFLPILAGQAVEEVLELRRKLTHHVLISSYR
jgi:hypothetical protein